MWLRCDSSGVPIVSSVHVEEQTLRETEGLPVSRSAMSLPALPPTYQRSLTVSSPLTRRHATASGDTASPLRPSVDELTKVMSAKLSHQSRSEQQQKEPKEPVPGISITEAARACTPPCQSETVLRHKWPLDARYDLEFKEYHEYLSKLGRGISKIDTVEFSLIGFFVALYETKQVIELSKLEILQP